MRTLTEIFDECYGKDRNLPDIPPEDEQPCDSTQHASLITPDRLENLSCAVERTVNVPGDMAELGVYRGGSARVIAQACPHKTLHLFDTFSGLPHSETELMDPKGLLKQGQFACTREEVERMMDGCRVEFHEGEFPYSIMYRLTNLDASYSFVHIDCDLYKPASAAIGWFWRRVNPGGILYFDDYGCEFTGVTRAVHETFEREQLELQHDINGFQIGALVVKQ